MKKFFLLGVIMLTLGAAHMGGAGGCGDSSTGGGTGGGTTGGTGGGTGGDTDGCNGLCEGAGFESGTETDFGGGLVECQCNGDGDVILQDDCTAYCSDFGVSAEDSLLTVDGDKCACDGTSP